VPAVVSYVYYYLDLHGRLVSTTKPPGRVNVHTRVLDLGGGELVEELRVMSYPPNILAVLGTRGQSGERWVKHDNPDDPEWTIWRRPHRDGGAS
jgi:hypothetical protein